VNAILTGEPNAVIVYGICNVTQHLFFIIQFAMYPSDVAPSKYYLLWLLFPLLPIFLGVKFPTTIKFTSFVKPLTQVLSHLPQIAECIRLSTTLGLSLATQHLNMMGGLAGLVMCYIIPTSTSTWLMYVNSIFQAVSIYFLAIHYTEFCGNRSEKEKAYFYASEKKDKVDEDISSDLDTQDKSNVAVIVPTRVLIV